MDHHPGIGGDLHLITGERDVCRCGCTQAINDAGLARLVPLQQISNGHADKNFAAFAKDGDSEILHIAEGDQFRLEFLQGARALAAHLFAGIPALADTGAVR